MTSTATITSASGSATAIHAAELRQLLDEDPETRILDVRTGAEFESLHIPGSFNVPLDTLAEHVRTVAELDHPVVLVCQSGSRATTAQSKLNAAGKSNLRVLQGGVDAWQKVGGTVVRGDQKWSLERQVRGAAGGIVLVSVLASLKLPGARFVAGGVGFGLLAAAVTDTCAMGTLLAKMPYNRGPRCDLDRVIDDMRSAP